MKQFERVIDRTARQKLEARHRDQCPVPFLPFATAALDHSIVHRFEQQIVAHADRVALVAGTQQLNYEALNAAANRIAYAIIAECGTRSEPVALLFAQGIDPIVSILGALKAGKCYLPLEPLYPPARTQYVLADSEARLLLTHTAQIGRAREIAGSSVRVLNIDTLSPHLTTENPGVEIAPDTLAYLMYTSGSTGRPKGVMETHRNVLHHMMRITNEFQICAADRQALLRSISFNGSVRDIFSVFLNGASLHPFDVEAEGLLRLAKWMTCQEITLYRSVVSFFRHFTSQLLDKAAFPHVRLINIGGEAVTLTDVALFQRYFSDTCVLASGLGITETGTVRHFYLDTASTLPGHVVPVGYPVEGLDVMLVDDEGREVAEGQTGEIAVKSRYISPGYWRQPDLTRQRFLACADDEHSRLYLTGDLGRMLPDGCLIHLGRKDFQVKVRGQRVEVAEIEAALLELEGVHESLVVSSDDGEGNPSLIAYYVAEPGVEWSVTTLRQALAETLSVVMIPARFVRLDAMPLGPTGKVNRAELPVPDRGRPALHTPFVAATSPVEVALTDIWVDVLDIEPIGIHDRFFDLGGHSLLATRVVNRIRERLGIELDLRDVFDTPTIAVLAQKLLERFVEAEGEH